MKIFPIITVLISVNLLNVINGFIPDLHNITKRDWIYFPCNDDIRDENNYCCSGDGGIVHVKYKFSDKECVYATEKNCHGGYGGDSVFLCPWKQCYNPGPSGRCECVWA
ncbi:hypothetical protein C2G38_2197580 [Gigaspora rosea]|uniref:Uncharacterized protein n=1 Tax=Gigaspora rosea TaxID=44941 RepID=A0A397UTH3_9GLOM|nr:hypothetical protein C2G38_2197580 [Gigaspora rosea]CAG8753959.1 12407_t:CDS:1 [Gigaspora rosea]